MSDHDDMFAAAARRARATWTDGLIDAITGRSFARDATAEQKASLDYVSGWATGHALVSIAAEPEDAHREWYEEENTES